LVSGNLPNRAVYENREDPGGGYVVNGYFNYQFLDKESNVLPYYVGTYLGAKRVFNVGAGFFYHQEGASYFENFTDTVATVVDPVTFAADVFYDAPIGNMAISAYASFTNHNWGPNFAGAPFNNAGEQVYNGALGGAGTGNIIYGQAGLALPEMSPEAGRFQPYLHFTYHDLDATEDADSQRNTLGVGLNWYEAGHNSKVTLEYQRGQAAAFAGNDPEVTSFLRLQMVIFL